MYKLLVLLFFLTSFFSCSEHIEDTFIVGMDTNYPPFEFTDSHGTLNGLDVELAEKIAQRLGKSLVLKQCCFDGLLLSLQQGKIDAVISGLSITPSREEQVLMLPYLQEKEKVFYLLFWQKIPEGLLTLSDLEGHAQPVAVQSGCIQENFLEQFSGIKKTALDHPFELFMDLKFGKSIAILLEEVTALTLLKENRELKALKVPFNTFSSKGFGVAVQKKQPELAKEIMSILDQMQENGEMQALKEKWLGGSYDS